MQLLALRDSMVRCRDRFRKLAPKRALGSHPVIGIVGEIFCRLNTFSNENLVRCLEEYGAEAWLSDIVEWIWYTNSEHFRKLKLTGRIWTTEALGAWVRKRVQKRDEHVLLERRRSPGSCHYSRRRCLERQRPHCPHGPDRRIAGRVKFTWLAFNADFQI